MKSFRSSSKPVTRTAGDWSVASFCACVLAMGLLYTPAVIAMPQSTLPTVTNIQTTGTLTTVPAVASSSVKIDQKPLTVRPNIPPNIVLMLDDSGSMASDYMPDWQYIGHCATSKTYCAPTIDELRDASINGTYYNPNVVYQPPPNADSTSVVPSNYPDSPSLGSAFKNGFTDQTADNEIDVTEYPWKDDGDESDRVNSYSESYIYNTMFHAQAGVQYPAIDGCIDGEVLDNGTCYTTETTFYKATRISGGSSWNPDNYKCDAGDTGPFWVFNGISGSGFECKKITKTATDDPVIHNTCRTGDSYDSTAKMCVTGSDTTAYLFTYATDDGNGNYTQHYVAKSAADCATAEADESGVDCDSSAATQQNVANWFSYYRTRMLMAKSGLMNAFSNLDSTYRIGFGSINANASSDIPTTPASYSFDDSTYRGGSETNSLAVVQPFGNGSDGTWKAKFWTWINNESPNGNTPLRKALEAVGEYFQSDQPWKTFEGETGYKSDASNPVLACRQSYTILTTDGFWNGSSPDVGNQDGVDGSTIQDPNGQPHKYVAAAPYTDSQDNTLADVAMKFWKNDLRSDIDNEVPTNSADMAFWQHMVTFTLGMGFIPNDADGNPIDSTTVASLLTWAQADDSANDGIASKPASLMWGGWPVPTSNSVNNIADLVHAGVNGHGGFYSATDPTSFVAGIQTALDRASERAGSGSGVAANSTQLQSNSAVYQAIYHTVEWTGELRAFPITADGLSKTLLWDAAQMMPAAADRNIQTWNPSTNTMVAFKNNSDGTPPTGLSSDTALGADPASQAKMVDWLRGSHADEQSNGGTLRNRTIILGDIVDSQPVYVGKVDANQFSGRSFTGSDSFVTTYANTVNSANNQEGRSPRLYVASNDGMLHGFNADTGVETFAFLPAAVITHGIAKAAQPDYGKDTNPHQFFNDGQLTVADAYIDEGTGASWHTILVGTTGRGSARAVYALDVTDPANVKVLWERSADDGGSNSDYIGQITGKPIIAQVVDANGDDTWVVLIGNGYNSAKDTAALLQFNLQDGTLHVHTAGTATGNGLATPAVWLSNPSNGLSDVAYAGDLKGNVWKFSLVSYGTDSKGNGTITGTPDSAGSLVYVAKDDSGNRQPITAGMLIGQDPDTSDLWLFFGTGRYLSSDDITDTSVQTWYGLVVEKGSTSSTMTAVTEDSTRSDLAERKVIAQSAGSTVTKDGKTIVTSPTRVVSLAPGLDPSTPAIDGTSGWYIDLLAPTAYTPVGERMVIPNQFSGTMILGTSIVPKSDDLCNPSGTSWLNLIDPFTGTNPQSGGFDVNHDGVIDGSDKVTITITNADGTTKTLKVIASGLGTNSMANSTSNVGQHGITSLTNGELLDNLFGGSGSNIKRVSWRELVNP